MPAERSGKNFRVSVSISGNLEMKGFIGYISPVLHTWKAAEVILRGAEMKFRPFLPVMHDQPGPFTFKISVHILARYRDDIEYILICTKDIILKNQFLQYNAVAPGKVWKERYGRCTGENSGAAAVTGPDE